MKPYQIDQEKWQKFTSKAQLGNIAAELARVTDAKLHDQNQEWISQALERALAMIEASIKDPQWKNNNILFQLRDAIARLNTDSTNRQSAGLLHENGWSVGHSAAFDKYTLFML